MEKQHLLLVSIGVVGAILREVVELLAVLIHTAQTLLQVQELLKLASHQALKDVLPMKSHAEFSPQHLVAVLNGGGEVSPPSTHGSMKLLDCEQGLLDLKAVQKPKLDSMMRSQLPASSRSIALVNVRGCITRKSM
jgi:hypothetical protein